MTVTKAMVMAIEVLVAAAEVRVAVTVATEGHRCSGRGLWSSNRGTYCRPWRLRTQPQRLKL